MKKTIIILVLIVVIVPLLVFLFTRSKKTTTTTPIKKTEISKKIELTDNEKPYISLIPRADGHELKFKVINIPAKFSTAEYELIYTAEDEGLEIEKGVSGTIKLDSQNFEKDLLLGTESCTNGCKYKYDEGIVGGVLTLTLTTDDKEYISFETPFVIKNSAQINKDKGISLIQENFEIKATVTSKNDFFIVIRNFKPIYSVFSNGKGLGKISLIEPSTVTKENLNSLVGDYLIP
ncbi:MAG: hypothetical protein PHO75_01970 [Candidatus Shapirobacteria bacterium]|jgi:hypothetical protein|nr:hypothetical protein [Candidatus Shapirobacteria bacterium]